MPNRILKDSICSSETLDALAAEEETLFYRLLVQCDDFGRFHGDPRIVLSACFPLRAGTITAAHVGDMLASLERAGAIRRYRSGTRSYLYFVTWESHQQRRAQHSKFPPPPDNCEQVQADDCNCEQVQSDDALYEESRNRGIEERGHVHPSAACAGAGDDSEEFDLTLPPKRDTTGEDFNTWWQRYPRKLNRKAAERLYRQKRRTLTAEQMETALTHFIAHMQQEARPPDKVMHATTFLASGSSYPEDYQQPIATAARVSLRECVDFDREFEREWGDMSYIKELEAKESES